MSDTPTEPQPTNLATAAQWIILLAGGLYLLRELGDILKPVFLAVLVAYVVLPVHFWVKKGIPGRLALVASALLSLGVLFLVTALVQSSVRTLAAEVPHLAEESQREIRRFQDEYAERYPATWKAISDLAFPARGGDAPVRDFTTRMLSLAADTVSTGAVVGLYLMFLLVEAARFPDKVRKAFTEPRAERILLTIAGINKGIADYLSAKVRASLILAGPVFVILFVFRTPLSLIWAVLTFFCNFVPYVGSLVGYSLPVLYVAVTFGIGWEAITIAILLLAIHVVSATVIEPKVIGRAVGVSPIVILLSLAFWGYCWGLTGMLLAVPLTVMAKIICAHIETTRPLAKLVSEE